MKFNIETVQQEKPLLLLFGNNSLIPPLVEVYKKNFKIVLISRSYSTIEDQNVYHVNESSAYLLDKLIEALSYAIFFVENEYDRRIADQLLIKCKKDNAKTILIFPIFSYQLFINFIQQLKQENYISFVFLGEVFNSKDTSSLISKIIEHARHKKSITFSENLNFIFPISQEDVLNGINSLLFRSRMHRRLFLLFYEHPQTIISAIHLLKRIEHDLSILYGHDVNKEDSIEHNEFIKKHRADVEREVGNKTGLTPFYLDSYLSGFEKSVKTILENNTEKNNATLIPEKPLGKPSKKKFDFDLNHIAVLAIASFIIFIFINVFLFFLSLYFARSSFKHLQSGNFSQASLALKKSRSCFLLVEPGITAGAKILSFFDRKKSAEQSLELFKSFIYSGGNIFLITSKLQNNSSISADELKNAFSEIIYLFFANQESNSKTMPLKEYRNFLALSSVAPNLLGLNGEKNYLLLFQNNGELRPTGGFIGSVGEATVSNGRLKKLSIKDVYDYDGQLKGHIEPHFVIRRHLQPHLYLRDSNFSPDFEKSASAAALLFNLESGKKMDGVVAIDFEVVKEIVSVLGPIKLFDYNRTIDETNLFEFLQLEIDSSFFPGSSTKKDLLDSLFTQIMLKLEQDPKKRLKVLQLIPKLVSEKHILIALPDSSLQSILSANGFSGSRDLRDQQKNTIFDMFGVNEANIGVNKANANVTRDVTYEIFLDKEQTLSSKATVTLINSGQKSIDYKTYIRFIAPKNSRVVSINIDGKEQTLVPAVTDFNKYESPSFNAPKGLEVDYADEGNMSMFGFITIVPKTKTQKIEVVYKNGLAPFSNFFTYSLLYFKQPGTAAYPLKVSIHHNEGYYPQNTEGASVEKNSVLFSEDVKTDKEFRVTLSKSK